MSDYVEQKLWERVDKYLPILEYVPFLRMVAVCNNLAFGKVTEKSDVDLFIIAKTGRLFLVRALVTMLLQITGVRRHGSKVAGRFCLSFFVDDSGLELERIAIKDDIYLAFWVKTMMPVLDDGVYGDFIANNRWVDCYFEKNRGSFHGDKRRIFTDKKSAKFLRKALKWLFSGNLGNFLEKLLKKWQLVRAGNKAKKVGKGSSLLVENHILKFHNIDRRQEYSEKWQQKFGKELLTEERFLQLF